MAGHRVLVFDIGGTNVRGAVCDPAPGDRSRRRGARHPTTSTTRAGTPSASSPRRSTRWRRWASELTGGVPRPPRSSWAGPGRWRRTGRRCAPDHPRPRSTGPCRWVRRPPTSGRPARCATLNDLSAAGYAYVGRGCGDFCVVTVGSGIGNKVFVDGRPLVGPGGRGGEIGHGLAHMPADCPGGAVEPGARLGDGGVGTRRPALAGRLARACPEAFAELEAGAERRRLRRARARRRVPGRRRVRAPRGGAGGGAARPRA